MFAIWNQQLNTFIKYIIDNKLNNISFDTNTNILIVKERKEILLETWNFVITKSNFKLNLCYNYSSLMRSFRYYNIKTIKSKFFMGYKFPDSYNINNLLVRKNNRNMGATDVAVGAAANIVASTDADTGDEGAGAEVDDETEIDYDNPNLFIDFACAGGADNFQSSRKRQKI